MLRSGALAWLVLLITTISISLSIPAYSAPPALSCDHLGSRPATTSTGEKPQSKVWNFAGSWWSVFPTNAGGASSAGTWLWRLHNDAWTETLRLSIETGTKADVKVTGNLAHILLYDATPELVSVAHVDGTYQLWSSRPAPSSLSLPNSEIATIEIDSAGRMWLATESGTRLVVHYSDPPYSTWNGPLTLATGCSDDDISVITAFPNRTIGVLWSNQNTRRFGFRTHSDGAAPHVWSADEVPASQSAQNIGLGMADDHLHVAVGRDGTLYTAVKTSYDTAGAVKIALLVRRPNGTWDALYKVDTAGTRPIILLNEAEGTLTVLYTSAEGYNNMIYKRSLLAPIAFGERTTLRTGSFNDASSTKQNYTGEFVVIYASRTEVCGSRCASVVSVQAHLAGTETTNRTESMMSPFFLIPKPHRFPD